MNFINLGWILFILWSTIYFWARLTSAYGILIGLAGLPLGLLIGVSIPVALDYLYLLFLYVCRLLSKKGNKSP
jgi:hypothetical protein